MKIDEGVDWSSPWLAGLRELGMQIAASENWRAELNQLAACRHLHNHNHLPIQFVAQQELPGGASYEAHINATGCVPTRDNLHDFFNALVWLTYPLVKAQLNSLQAAQIARIGIGKSRGPSRDAATLFDENAALLAVTDTATGHELVQALRSHQWDSVFVQQRAQCKAHITVALFGHAIMEKLARPYKAITAHTLVCWVQPDFHGSSAARQHAILDSQIAAQLAAHELLPSIFSPLPILGVPDWWPNQDMAFYADTGVFRAPRLR